MNISVRKLAMLEKSFLEKEEAARINGYATNSIDADLQRRVKDLMDKIRVI